MADLVRKGDTQIQIVDPVTQVAAKVDSQGRILVSQEVSSPPAATNVARVVKSNIIGQTDDLYIITNTKTLTITLFQAGSEQVAQGGSKIELFEDPNGDLSVLNLIAVAYVNGNSTEANINQAFVGNGTRRIVMRRDALGAGGSREVFGRWSGFEA